MPFGGNWSEELVAEWLSLKGYLVEVHVPAGSAEAGGRYAADVVGVKVKGGKMEICHAEVGTLPRDFEKSVETIKRKFSESVVERIKRYFQERIKISEGTSVEYKKVYVTVYVSKKVFNRLKEEKKEVEVKTLQDVIKDAIEEIRNFHPNGIKSARGTLPESLWLLKLIEHIQPWLVLEKKQEKEREKRAEQKP
ncbi:MAG: hypothetical protein ACP5IG_04825 [Candidatus Micrarchaeia archaeon]